MKGMKTFFSDKVFPKGRIFVRANVHGERVMKKMNGFEWKPAQEPSKEDDSSDYVMLNSPHN